MKRVVWLVLPALACVGLACGGGGDGNVYEEGDGDGDGDGATSGDGDGDGDGSGDGDGDGTGDGDGDGDGGPRLDVSAIEDIPGDCSCGLNLDFSYIWIANAEQGTVSKIDTETVEELGRYVTRPDGSGNPSRTSVNLNGDVAIANRHGGLVKIHAREADCEDTNGTPGIQTSTGKDDLLAWGEEECVAWYVDSGKTNQRPVAWTAGDLNQTTCRYENTKVWTVASTNPGLAPGTGGAGGVTVYRIDGETGDVENELEVPTFNGIQLGAYGGAVDKHGNLWFVPMGGVALPPRRLGFIDGDNLSYQVWDMPGEVASYGVTVAADGRVWISSTIGASGAVFDPDTEEFTLIQQGFLSLGGLAQDVAADTVWISTSSGAVAVDEASLTVTQTIDTPGGGGVKGVAVDRDDYVWLVTDIEAYRFDTDDLSYLVYDGLTGPYTYSDMTGSALANAECGPEG